MRQKPKLYVLSSVPRHQLVLVKKVARLTLRSVINRAEVSCV